MFIGLIAALLIAGIPEGVAGYAVADVQEQRSRSTEVDPEKSRRF
jgi:hypothetical protein